VGFMGLQFLLDSQKKFQKRLGYDLDSMNLQERAKYIKEQILWSTDELHEMLHELPFAKDWSTKYYKMTPEQIQHQLGLSKEEFIDFLHFAVNIALALDLTEEEIIRLYKEKNKINYERQENGY
jgi:dimeric dUTPase (all-alpha-NTP-PPase superfamily)